MAEANAAPEAATKPVASPPAGAAPAGTRAPKLEAVPARPAPSGVQASPAKPAQAGVGGRSAASGDAASASSEDAPAGPASTLPGAASQAGAPGGAPPTAGSDPGTQAASLLGAAIPNAATLPGASAPIAPVLHMTAPEASAFVRVASAGTGPAARPVAPASSAQPASAAAAQPSIDARGAAGTTDADASDAFTVAGPESAATPANAASAEAAGPSGPSLLNTMQAVERLRAAVEADITAPAGGAALPADGATRSQTAGVPLAGADAAQPASWLTVAAALQDPASASAQGGARFAVGTPVPDAGFGQDLGHNLVLLVHNGVQSAELTLQPANLGPLRVEVQMQGQAASLTFAASHEATRAALQDALPQLHALFEQSGLRLAGTQIGSDAQTGTGGSAWQDGANRSAGTAADDVNGPQSAQPAVAGMVLTLQRAGLVDTFA